ncbi:hypothetical protein I79_013921 [Cricetulus griseus]|uniref:Uncharacterized protein n=1 Tax=Cricetulus griseus TaxID=10029 RepID=G3HSS7_CRIGR|nr:hypothetical protein I79_013921 [Cricetulus griseus]
MIADICFGKEGLLEKPLNELITNPRKSLPKFSTCVTHIGKTVRASLLNQDGIRITAQLAQKGECCHCPHKELASASPCLLKILQILSINSCQANPSGSLTGQIQKPTHHTGSPTGNRGPQGRQANTKNAPPF